VSDSSGTLLASLADQTQDGKTGLEIAAIWREARVSCPGRHWLARRVAGTLEGGPADFVEFHLNEMKCEWCQANYDDLASQEANLEPLLERVRASTAGYLRSKTVES